MDNKEELNKRLEDMTKNLYGRVTVIFGLITPKWVNVRDIRTCFECRKKIEKGDISLTSSYLDDGYKVRIHRCYECGMREIHAAIEYNMEERMEEALDYDEW